MNSFRSHSLGRPNVRLKSLCAAGLLAGLCAAPAFAVVHPPADVQARYEQERARCLAGQSGQAQDTCLKEAGAARDAAKKNQLSDGDGQLRKNAKERCDALAGDDKRDCLARMKGAANSTESGSVKGGGILRETVTTVPAPAASPASPVPAR